MAGMLNFKKKSHFKPSFTQSTFKDICIQRWRLTFQLDPCGKNQTPETPNQDGILHLRTSLTDGKD